jgi:hypothetical protein
MHAQQVLFDWNLRGETIGINSDSRLYGKISDSKRHYLLLSEPDRL